METDRLKFCIERFDHYFDSINNKSAVFLALGTFIVGGLIASCPYLKDHTSCSVWMHLLIMLSIALGLTAMIVVIVAATPYKTMSGSSKFYYYSIASTTETNFCKESKEYTEEEELEDLRIQVHCLATGLKVKFQRLRIAGILLTLMFFMLIPLIILIVITLK